MKQKKVFNCKNCHKPINESTHYFLIESNHLESSNSYDTVKARLCIVCAIQTNLVDLFDWHIKGCF